MKDARRETRRFLGWPPRPRAPWKLLVFLRGIYGSLKAGSWTSSYKLLAKLAAVYVWDFFISLCWSALEEAV
jgi:hypothetical protein